MKTLVVIEGNCGDEGQQYRAWLEENLPDDIELNFRADCFGVNGGMFDGGMFDDDGNFVEDEANMWWDRYCDS